MPNLHHAFDGGALPLLLRNRSVNLRKDGLPRRSAAARVVSSSELELQSSFGLSYGIGSRKPLKSC